MPASLSIPFASAITTTTTTTPTTTSWWRRKLEALSFLPANFRMQFAYIISNNVSASRTHLLSRPRHPRLNKAPTWAVISGKRREVVLLQTRTVEQTCMIVDDDIAADNLPSERNFTTLFSFPLPNKLGRSFFRNQFLCLFLSLLSIFSIEECIIRPNTTPSCISLFRRYFPRVFANDWSHAS